MGVLCNLKPLDLLSKSIGVYTGSAESLRLAQLIIFLVVQWFLYFFLFPSMTVSTTREGSTTLCDWPGEALVAESLILAELQSRELRLHDSAA